MSDTDDATLRQFKAWFKADREHSAKWRESAAEDFAFLAGEQYTDEEKRILKEQLRPIVTFNRTHPIINSISGMEITNRQEVKYFPREEGDAKANELLTEGAKWFRDQADADDEDSTAFLDSCVCGVGCTETTLDYDEDEEGAPTMEAVNPLETYWDKGARQKNLADRQRDWRVRKIPRARAMEMFPDADPDELDAAWANAEHDEDEAETQEDARKYEDEGENFERDQEDVTIVHLQYKKRVPVYVVAGVSKELSADDFAKAKKRFEEVGVRLAFTRKMNTVVRNVFIGSEILQKEADALCKKHFSRQFVTAYREHKTGLFYGLMRLMKDPQRWANKWMSQALHILNSNAKGGLLMEKDATDDQRKFEKDWARPDKINWVNEGALIAGKIKEKGQTAMPAGFFQMMEFAIQSVRDVTGISVELLGMREANQAASLEYQRKQAGMTIVAPLFDNLKRYRRDHGKLMLYIIQNYLADGRLVRIVGDGGAQYVPLALKADLKYDIIVDDQPNSPDQKMMVWNQLMPLMPNLPPQIQLALVEYAPLPTSVIEKIKAAAATIGQQPNPEQQRVEMEGKAKEAELALRSKELDQKAQDSQARNTLEAAKLLQGHQQMGLEHQKMMHASAEGEAGRKHEMGKNLVAQGLPPDYSHERENQKFAMLMAEMGASREQTAQMLQVLSQQTNGVAQAIAQLSASQDRATAAQLAPKRVIKDKSGSPVGIETIAA